MGWVSFLLHMVLIENLVLSYGIGIDQVLHRNSLGRGQLFLVFHSTLILSVAGAFFWIFFHGILVPLELEFLSVLVGLLIITALTMGCEFLLHRKWSFLRWSFGEYRKFLLSPLVFGFLMIMVIHSYSFLETMAAAFVSSLGLGLVGSLLSHVRMQMRLENVPKFLQGEPTLFLILGMISLGFSLFDRVIYLIIIR